MNGQIVSKLIRDEIWGSLRLQGFSKFESRSAYRYQGSVIHVINFQSFSSDLADKLGCTTFSFALNLGVYIAGSLQDRRIRQDKAGRLLPYEYECALRAGLRKREPVDGFRRTDIFYIDRDGHTSAACFEESRFLLMQIAPIWFSRFSDVSQIIAAVEGQPNLPIPLVKEISAGGAHGSVNWHLLMGALRLAQFQRGPSQETESALREEGVKLFGAYLNLPSNFASLVKDQVSQVGEFLGMEERALGSSQFGFSGHAKEVLKEQFWPLLKHRGFSSFGARTARRNGSQAIEVIEFARLGFGDRARKGSSDEVFQMRLGVYWPLLPLDRFGKQNSVSADGCHITSWLFAPKNAQSSLTTAKECIELSGLPWLSSFENPESALSILQKSDWEIFSLLPTTRQIGAEFSPRRLLFLSFFAFLCHRSQLAKDYLDKAANAIDSDPRPVQKNYQRWHGELRSIVAL